MNEIGLHEFTAEMQPDRQYKVSVESPVAYSGLVNLRYAVSTDPEVEPPPVSLASDLFGRWVLRDADLTISKLVQYDCYAHFRFLLTADRDPRGFFEAKVEESA